MNHEIDNQDRTGAGSSVRKDMAARRKTARIAKTPAAKKKATSNLLPARSAGRPKSYGSNDDLATRRVILEAALQTFSLYGFEGASITRIARMHGVSPPLIHYYFATKDELWRAAMEQGIGDMVRNLEEISAELVESDCIARLKFFIRRYLGIVAERPAVFRVIVRESDMPSPRLTWLAHHYMTPLYQLIAGLIEQAQAAGRLKTVAPPYHMAQIITGACYHFLASRNRMLETYGIEVNTREIRELHSNAVIDILFTGMLTANPADGGAPR
jgi:AcrR family transcriptional regulator